MTGKNNISRRVALGAPAAMALASVGAACAADEPASAASPSRTLVAYLSRSGNTRVIAGQLHRTLKADLFEIVPAKPYPEDYLEMVAQAETERRAGFEPPLKAAVPHIADYKTIYLGFPIWGETAPSPIRSFLKAHDLSTKTLRPFITHGGYGLGNSIAVLKSHAPGARLQEAFVMQADQERRTMTEVASWLGEIKPA